MENRRAGDDTMIDKTRASDDISAFQISQRSRSVIPSHKVSIFPKFPLL